MTNNVPPFKPNTHVKGRHFVYTCVMILASFLASGCLIGNAFSEEIMEKDEKLILHNISGTKLLEQIGKPNIGTAKLQSFICSYYEKFYKEFYPTFRIFLNCLILSPESVPQKESRLLGNPDGFNYGPYYLRYFAILSYYGTDFLFRATQIYIDRSLVNDDEVIKYGGVTPDGKHVLARLPKTLAELIKELKKLKR